MKLDMGQIIKENFDPDEKICICANLPYYVTSPIIMHLLKSDLPIDSITVMVQKEAGERICADVGDKKAGAITVAVSYYSSAKKLFDVPRSSFYPSPKVDSEVIMLDLGKRPSISVENEENFFKLTKALFAQRRKTLINTVSNTISVDKEKIRSALKEMGLDDNIRGETLKLDEIAKLSNILFTTK